MNITWEQISYNRFVSSDGNFSITYNEGEEFRWTLHAIYNGKNKTYNYRELQGAFFGAQNIWRPNYRGGR